MCIGAWVDWGAEEFWFRSTDIESVESDLYLPGFSSLSMLSLLASKRELRHPDLRAGRGRG